MNDEVSKLPNIDIMNDKFMNFNNDINDSYLNKLINKNVIYRVKENGEIIEFYGKVEKVSNSKITFVFGDYKKDYLKKNIKEIEEIKVENDLDIVCNVLCKVTNVHNDSIICIINKEDPGDDFSKEVELIYKYNDEIDVTYYPKYMISKIEILSSEI